MEHRTKQNHTLINLVNDFEAMLSKDNVGFLSEKSFYELLSYYEEVNQTEKAIEVVEYAIDQFPYRSEFLLSKARLLLTMSLYQESLQVLEQAQNISPYEIDIAIFQIRALCGMKQVKAAKKRLDEIKVSKRSLDEIEILLAHSYILEAERDYHEMFDILKKALKIDMTNIECLERMWQSVELSKRFDDSIVFHEVLVKKKPYSAYAWYNLGHSYASVGEYVKAIESLEYAFIIDKDMESAYLDCAELCVQIQDFDKGLSIYEEANQYFGPDSELLVYIADCQIKLNNFLSAKASLFTALSIDPYNDEIYYFLGQCYAKEKNWHSAINAYQKSISIENDCEIYHASIADCFLQLGKSDLALKHLKRACKILPEESSFWIKRTCIYIKEQKYNKALDVLEMADMYTIDTRLLYFEAICLAKLGDKKAALSILDKALNENFDDHESIYEIAPEFKFDKDILSIINYYEGENK